MLVPNFSSLSLNLGTGKTMLARATAASAGGRFCCVFVSRAILDMIQLAS